MGIIQRQGIINSILTYIGIVVGALNIIVFMPMFLSKEEIGLTRVLFSFSALVAQIVPLGMSSITLKFFPNFRDKDNKHHGFFGLSLFLPAVGFVIAAVLILTFKTFITAQYNRQSPLINEYFNYILPLTFFLAFSSVLTSYCFSLFKSSFPVFINDVLVRVLAIILYAVYFLKFITLDQFIMLYVLKFGVQMLMLLFYIFQADTPGLKVNYTYFKTQQPKAMLKYGLLLSFTALSSLGLKYIDVVMLGKYVSLDYVGIYAIAVFIPTVIEAPLGALEKIGIASIAEAWKRNDKAEVKNIYFRSSKYLLLAGGLLFLCVNLSIGSLFELFPDKGFALGQSVVLIISIGTLVNMATGINDAIIYTSDKYIYGAYMLMILFVIAIVNNYILIPIYGMNGAALATVISATVFNIMKFAFLWKEFDLQPFNRKTPLIFLTIGICFGVVWFLPSVGHPLVQIVYRSVLIIVMYIGLVKVFNIVPELEAEAVRMIRKRLG